MADMPELKLITGAWADVLSEFVGATRRELLIASPWMTASAARLVAHHLSSVGPVTLHILARMDEADFRCGTSHLVAFREDTYPGNVRVVFRALPLLHGKMLVVDRRRVILGSANMTDGGLYRNHEISVQGDSGQLGEACAQEFFRLWAVAFPVPDRYLDDIETALSDTLPPSDDGTTPEANPRQPQNRRSFSCPNGFRYASPPNATASRALLAKALQLPSEASLPHEDRDVAIRWLERSLKFTPREQRGDPAVVLRLERLMYHPDNGVRATALDRAGRSGRQIVSSFDSNR